MRYFKVRAFLCRGDDHDCVSSQLSRNSTTPYPRGTIAPLSPLSTYDLTIK